MFLCTGNSARSQMAEGLARELSQGLIEVHSAGTEPKGLHPLSVAVMDEIGIDIREQCSKKIDPALLNQMDWIITVCAQADKRCPVTPPHIHREHWPLEDPATAPGSEAEQIGHFREIRNEIHDRLSIFLSKNE